VVAGTALAAIVSRLFARRVVAPVTELTEAAEHIEATGDLGRRIDAEGHDEVGRMAARFNAMVARLQASQAQQRRLVADASHELRTPVTSMRTNVEVLRDAPAMAEPDRRALLDDVVEQAEELGNLVGDLIELARDGEAPLSAEDVRLDDLVAEAVVRARRHAPTVDFTLRAEPSIVTGAPDRLGRAVNNLLDNAAQHSSRVEVTVGGEGVVAVRDHGPGVPPEDVEHLFDRFYRGATARGRPGSGLGLAIVRQVAEAHGGSVRLESPEDGGALFVLTLPGSPA
jgi:two-component system sensor histidine kinase MprB